ncbi:hypothetical protein KKF91_06655 [Myxococcota bacterium]|nr:hypothetical protein [Myxococcota bacterium]MBU1430235.1 hypothetical protein [Myxococcota bacterium]MBU1898345.1 hypothetical protein [Myxococcota bacterium]
MTGLWLILALISPPALSAPAADRLFAIQLKGEADHLILGADKDELFLIHPNEAAPRWRVKGPGAAHQAIAADLGQGERIYVAWGVGRGFLNAPLMLTALDPATGTGALLWTRRGERNEVTHLSADDVDGDGRRDLAVAYYESKYRVRTRHITAAGGVIEGPPIRMANAWAFGDLDQDGQVDQIIGRVYGEAKGDVGDLRMITQGRSLPIQADDGVRAVTLARLRPEAPLSLFFSDGWVSNYGQGARAQIKRAVWDKGVINTEAIAASAKDFTFFDLWVVDLEGDGLKEIIARGNSNLWVFKLTDVGWRGQIAAQLGPMLNVALGLRGGRWWAYLPGRPQSLAVSL